MVEGWNEGEVRKIATGQFPEPDAIMRLLLTFQNTTEPFRFCKTPNGFEIASETPVEGRPARAQVKIFPLKNGDLVAFFFKRSNLVFSRDRFSYGGVVFEGSEASEEMARQWIAFLDSGLDWHLQPKGLKKALSFTIPE